MLRGFMATPAPTNPGPQFFALIAFVFNEIAIFGIGHGHPGDGEGLHLIAVAPFFIIHIERVPTRRALHVNTGGDRDIAGCRFAGGNVTVRP